MRRWVDWRGLVAFSCAGFASQDPAARPLWAAIANREAKEKPGTDWGAIYQTAILGAAYGVQVMNMIDAALKCSIKPDEK